MQVEGEPRYAKTRENYGYYLHNGIMLQLESLETFPAPVLCPSCEKPIITALENERSMNDKYVNALLITRLVDAGKTSG